MTHRNVYNVPYKVDKHSGKEFLDLEGNPCMRTLIKGMYPEKFTPGKQGVGRQASANDSFTE